MRPLLCCLVLLVTSCSALVDWSVDGLPCDEDRHCRAGYVCSPANVCVAEEAPTEGCPCASPFDACVDDRCVPSCDLRPCAAGEECRDGGCQPVAARTTAASCAADDGCASGDVCLLSSAGGFCTRRCSAGGDCGGLACRSVAGVRLCAPASLTACGEGVATFCGPAGLAACRTYAGDGISVDLCGR